MTQFFRTGYYEYDKRPIRRTRTCLRCGCEIPARKRYCGPCYGVRYEENIAANRHKYRKPRMALP